MAHALILRCVALIEGVGLQLRLGRGSLSRLIEIGERTAKMRPLQVWLERVHSVTRRTFDLAEVTVRT